MIYYMIFKISTWDGYPLATNKVASFHDPKPSDIDRACTSVKKAWANCNRDVKVTFDYTEVIGDDR